MAFRFAPLFRAAIPADIPFRKLPQLQNHVSSVRLPLSSTNAKVLAVAGPALTELAATAMRDVSHLLRPSHLAQLAAILRDPEASSNDRFVALDLLKNANIAAGMLLPSCQDTGTATVVGTKARNVVVTGTASEHELLAEGIHRTYTTTALRYSQLAPLSMYDETNTRTNLPAQIEISSDDDRADSTYKLFFLAKGGGSANKTALFQESKAVLNPDSLLPFLEKHIRALGTGACPPYHLSVVIGGLSADMTIKTVKLAAAGYYDALPVAGTIDGTAFRDLELEQTLLSRARASGIGAQFGGKYFAHDVRVIRLPRHGGSCPIGLGVSCSAHRQIFAKITEDGVFLEQLETDPARFFPDDALSAAKNHTHTQGNEAVSVNIDRPISEILAQLRSLPVSTRLSLNGTLVVARDLAHARMEEQRKLGKGLPDYMKNHLVYYSGPAKTPATGNFACGSFGPTTAGRMDSYMENFMREGGALITLAKGNRSKSVRDACKKYGGMFLGSIGGPAARLAHDCITKIEVLDYEDLGMEAVWRVVVKDFPAFVVIDQQGNDFFSRFMV
eukprot:TRINITY_DN3647_c0_g1_i2.p1 TRINITY_DN3647_c0_g1~~TRINITY_DN3647_c0_g1_i2.p1  ORF type:complete len:559 (-),score=110.02 TRINITY_DN3647_c0_g1_i2:7-1683(-)